MHPYYYILQINVLFLFLYSWSMRLPTVCFRHVLVLSGCRFNASVSLFSPSTTFFSGYFCTFLCSLPVLHCARSRSGGVRCVVFYKHDLAFVPFSFFHPLHVGEHSVKYPQWVISIPTDNSNRNVCTSVDTLVVNIISFLQPHCPWVVLSFSLCLGAFA